MDKRGLFVFAFVFLLAVVFFVSFSSGDLYESVFNAPSTDALEGSSTPSTGSSCSHTCYPYSTKSCLTATTYQICGNYDSDSCLEYGSPISCPSNYICSNGNCVLSQQTQPTYLACLNSRCVNVNGTGVNQCSSDLNCSSSPSSTGRASISSIPAGASIFLNNIYYGNTPWESELESGIYQIVLIRGGYNPATLSAVLSGGETLIYNVYLEPVLIGEFSENSSSNASAGVPSPEIYQDPGQTYSGGVSGSGGSAPTFFSAPQGLHSECVEKKCVLVEGDGENKCFTDPDCGGQAPSADSGNKVLSDSELRTLEGTTGRNFEYKDACETIDADVRLRISRLQKEGKTVVLKEGEVIYGEQYFVIPGAVMQVTLIKNATGGKAGTDEIHLKNALTGKVYKARPLKEGEGSVNIAGEDYKFIYNGAAYLPTDEKYIVFNYPQTDGNIKFIFENCLAFRACSAEGECVGIIGNGTDECTSSRQCSAEGLLRTSPEECSRFDGESLIVSVRRFICETFGI